MKLIIIVVAGLLAAVAEGHAQNVCHFYLANQSDATSGVLLSLEASADSSGKCVLGSLVLRLNVGDGTAFHHVDASFPWQIGMVYTAQAVLTGAGPQQLSINSQAAGTVQGGFKPAQATFGGSMITDSGSAETYLVSQISLQVVNGSNTLSVAPNGNSPLPTPLVLLAGGPAPWQAAFTGNSAQKTTITASFRFDTPVANPHQFDPYIDTYGQAISAMWTGKIASLADLQATVTKEQAWLADNGPVGGLDKFGGSTIAGVPDQATGYYHAARLNGRWYLISPLGNPLFYIGVTAIPSFSTPITGREAMFQLPPQNGEFADAYGFNLNGAEQNTTYFSFHTANEIRKYGSSWQDVRSTLLHQRFSSWGFAGGGKFGTFPPDMPSTPILAHNGFVGVSNAVVGGHPDVFDSDVVNKVKASLAAEIGSDLTNPYIVGWAVGNETDQIIDVSEVTAILGLGASSAAKKAFVDYALSTLYTNNLGKLVNAWGITASTVADVYASKPNAPEGDVNALRLFYQQTYFSALYKAVKAVDPNHLYFGGWILGRDSTNWPYAAANCDVVGFDDFTPGLFTPDVQALITAANKPVMLGAWGVPSDYGGARGFGWGQYTQSMTLSDSASGDAYSQGLQSVASNPYVVGAMLFDYADEPLTGRGNSAGVGNITAKLVVDENYAFGLVDVTDTPKYDLVTKVRTANITALQSLGLLGMTPVLTSAPANGATYVTGGLVPGSWALVKGTNLSDVARFWQDADFTGLGSKLPTNLSGVQVVVNGAAAAVYYVSPMQVSFQVPAGVSGTANVQVIRDGLVSNTMSAQAVDSAPGIFPIFIGGKNYAAAVFLDGKIAADPSNGTAFRNAVPGDVVQLFATGLAASPAGTTVSTTILNGVTVTIGTVTIPASAAALVAVGEFQINFTVPQQFASLPPGDYPMTIAVNGVASPAVINSSPAAVVIPIQH